MQDINVSPSPRLRPAWTLGDRIRKARDEAGMPQAHLADALGVVPKTVARWEAGHTQPTLDVLDRIADATNVDPAWLVLGEG